MMVAMIAPTKAFRVSECPISDDMKASAERSPIACHGRPPKSIPSCSNCMRELLSACPEKTRAAPYQFNTVQYDDIATVPPAPWLRTLHRMGRGKSACASNRLAAQPHAPPAAPASFPELPCYNINGTNDGVPPFTPSREPVADRSAGDALRRCQDGVHVQAVMSVQLRDGAGLA